MHCKKNLMFIVCLSVQVSVHIFSNITSSESQKSNHTWHKALLGEDDSSLFKKGPCPLSKGNNNYIPVEKIHWRLLLQNHRANFNLTCQKHYGLSELSFFQMMDLAFLIGDKSNKFENILTTFVFSRTVGQSWQIEFLGKGNSNSFN